MDEWQSGILSYYVLLPSQVLILGVMLYVRSHMVKLSNLATPTMFLALRIFACVYALTMLVRFFVYVQAQLSGLNFLGGWIPIAFHLVLAYYLFLLAAILEDKQALLVQTSCNDPNRVRRQI